jgi:hypothetical protein
MDRSDVYRLIGASKVTLKLLSFCGEPAISHDSHHVSLVQWTNLFASRHKGHRFKSPGGYLCETGILLLAMSRYILFFFFNFYAPKNIFCFNSTVSGCNGGNRIRYITLYTWRFSPLSYNRHPTECFHKFYKNLSQLVLN